MNCFSNHPSRLLLAAALCAAVFTASTRGDEPTTKPAAPIDEQTVRGWFSELANREAEVRERARTELMGMPRQQLPLLQRLVQEERPLAPSQIAVLREIVAQIYLAGEPYETNGRDAFLGITMSQVRSGGSTGVVVDGRKVGFCGCRMLRDGDVILGLADQPDVVFHSPADLQDAISHMRAGDTVKLQVLRHGQVKQVRITLDARPSEVIGRGVPELDEWVHRRLENFAQYWQRTFAPLVREDIS